MPRPSVGPSTSTIMQAQSSFKCDSCEEFFGTDKERAHHYAWTYDLWKCVERSCPSGWIKGYKNLVAHHDSEKHRSLSVVSCNMCNKESKNFANWRRHAIQKHRPKPSGQADDSEALPIELDSDDESGTQDEVGHDVGESSTSANSGKSGEDDAVESFRCRACFCRLESEDERDALIHAEKEHNAQEADGKAQCQVCRKHVMYDKLAKHGFQKHVHEFYIHCPFCIDRMKYIDLMSHAMTCSKRPQKLDDETIKRALREGCVPVPKSRPVQRIRTPDTTRPENVMDSVAPPEEPITIKKEGVTLFNGK